MTKSLCGFSLLFLLSGGLWGSDLIRSGDVYALGGNPGGASFTYNIAVMEDPRLSLDLGFLVRRSRVGLELGDEELAKALLHRAQNLAISDRDIGQTNWLLGIDAFFVKDYEAARRFFSQALVSDPNPPIELLYYSGWTLYKIGDYEGARNVLLNLADLNQGKFPEGELNLLLASIAYRTADLDEVRSRLAGVSDYPKDSWFREEGLYLAGFAAFATDSLVDSKKYFSQMQDSTRKGLSLARIALEEGRFDEAAALYGRIESEEGCYGLATALYMSGKADDSEVKAKEYLFRYPEGNYIPNAYLLLSIIERGRGQNDKAVDELSKGLALNSKISPRLLNELAEIEFTRKRYSRSAEVCSALIKDYPFYSASDLVMLLEARSFFYLGETDSATEILKKTLAATKDEVIENETHYYLGEALARKGDYLNAAEELSMVKEGSSHFKALKRRGEVLALAGRNTEAVASFREALKEAPTLRDKEDLLLAIEERRLSMGYYKDRASMMKSYLELYPDAAQAPQIALEIALDYVENRKWVTALHELNKLLDRYPESDAAAEALYYKARCQRSLGQTDDALETYRQIALSYPSSPVVSRSQTEIATLLLSLGRSTEALSIYRTLYSSTRIPSERSSYTLKMAEIYYSQGNNQTAADLTSAALSENPPAEMAQRILLFGMEVELARGNLVSAENYSTRYRNRFGATPEYLLKKASIDKASGNLKDALAAYREAASKLSERSESRIDALIGAAETAYLLGRTEEARRYLEQASIEVQLDRQRVEITRKLQLIK